MTQKLPTPRAVAFDLDGTLIDSRGDIAASCNHVLKWSGRAPLPAATVAGFVGDGARTLLARATGLPRESPEIDPLLAEWARYYAAHPTEYARWMPGAREAMAALRARGARVALLTNKSRVVTLAILEALGVAKDFDFVWAGGDGKLKPDPESVLAVMRALGTSPEDTWVVGDGHQDIGAARAAGCVAIAVRGGFHPDERLRDADVVLASLEELPALLG